MLEKFDPSRYALSKFYYNIDAYLYSMGADEETGESEYGGWYGLFAGPFEPSVDDIKEHDLTEDDIQYLSHMAGAILRENSQGFVSSTHYENNDDLCTSWSVVNTDDDEIVDDEDKEPLEPEEGDLTSSNGTDWYQYGKKVFTISEDLDRNERNEELQAFMDKEQFWPNCWNISDHGNAHIISFDQE